MMVCGKYFLNVHWPTCDKQIQHCSSKKLARTTGNSTTVSEEIELKCHALFEADSTWQLLHGSRFGRFKLKVNETDCRHKFISSSPPITSENKLIQDCTAQFDNNHVLLTITSAVEIGQDALSLIKFTGSKQNLNGFERNACLLAAADHDTSERVATNESRENEAKLSILRLSLGSEDTGKVVARENDDDDDESSLPKCPIKGNREPSISSLEVNLSTLRAEFDGLRETVCLDNKSHVNITTTSKSGIVVQRNCPALAGLENNSVEFREKAEAGQEESNITSLEKYNKKQHKSAGKQSRESSKNKSLKATFTRGRRHFGHWLMATCSWKQAATRQVSRLILSSKQHQHQEVDHKIVPPNFMIMISYCHKEAQQYALRLKKSLEEIGLGVYLDVDEICKGCDWQDSLNEAIYKCHAFVPLVTPSYGETLWTRREFKLADALDKHIIPINFCASWPPAKLAIQFATVQYIFWLGESSCSDVYYNNSCEEEGEEGYGHDDYNREEVFIPNWPRACIRSAACQIKTSIRQRLEYLSSESPFQVGEELPIASCSNNARKFSADSMFYSSSYSPELDINSNNQFRWFRGKGNDDDDGVQTSGEEVSSREEGIWRNTSPRLELNEEGEESSTSTSSSSPFTSSSSSSYSCSSSQQQQQQRQKEMQISCRSFSLLPQAADQIETQLSTKIVETKTLTATTATTTLTTMTKKESLRLRAVKTFNKVKRRLNGYQKVTRG